MHNAAGGGTSARNEDLHDAIVSDLIEQAVPDDVPLGYRETGTNIFVLDDVTPRYVRH